MQIIEALKLATGLLMLYGIVAWFLLIVFGVNIFPEPLVDWQPEPWVRD